MVVTFRDKFNKKYNFPKDSSHSIADIARTTGFSKKGLEIIFKKGMGAFRTNPQSVRPSVTSPQQWSYARIYSAVMGGPAAKVDAKELAMK